MPEVRTKIVAASYVGTYSQVVAPRGCQLGLGETARQTDRGPSARGGHYNFKKYGRDGWRGEFEITVWSRFPNFADSVEQRSRRIFLHSSITRVPSA